MTDLCIPLHPPEFHEARLGPHYRDLVHYYANPTAEAALSRKLKHLPEGSVLVKEKLTGVGVDDPAKATRVSGIGGMIKRSPGYDEGQGNWEYFYVDLTIPFTTGKLKTCSGCHSKAKDDDFVFRVRDLPK